MSASIDMSVLVDVAAAPLAVVNYPAMSTKKEKALLYRLARDVFRGEGVIIDAGIFLGASTNAFACGLKDNRSALARLDQARKPIQSFDTAIWVRSMEKYRAQIVATRAKDAALEVNKSFFPALQALLADHLDLIEFRIGDIVETATTDAPVEVAFYDCLKTNERDLAVFKAFTPHYIPGHTIVVQQDYFFDEALDNKIRQEYFSSYFSFLGEESTSAVFRYERPIPQHAIDGDPVASLGAAAKLQLLQQAAERAVSAKSKVLTELAIVAFCLEIGEMAQAVERLSAAEERVRKDGATMSKRPAEAIARLWKRIKQRSVPEARA